MSAVFSATFSAVAVSAAQDLFEIVAPNTSRVAIRSISLGQYSDAGDAQAEMLSVPLIRGYTTSGGTSVTPINAAFYCRRYRRNCAVEPRRVNRPGPPGMSR